MHRICLEKHGTGILIGAPGYTWDIKGTETIFMYDSVTPLEQSEFLDKIASVEPHHSGKPKIDDAQRFAVEVCTIAKQPQPTYRVIVGYWYSRLGVFLDGIPRPPLL